MRSLTSLAVLGLGLLVGVAPLRAQQAGQSAPNIAYVNSQAVLQKAPGADSAQRVFQQEAEELRQEARQLSSRVDSLRQAFQQQQGMLSEQARRKRQQQVLQEQRKVQQRVTQMEKKLSKRQQELLQPILNRIQSVIETVRAERGYAMVFDVSGPGVVAADPALNITDEVIRRLQRRSGAASDSAAGSGPGSGG